VSVNILSFVGVLECCGEKGSIEIGKQANVAGQWQAVHDAGSYK